MPTRNSFYDLPKELQQVIYEFDPTYRMVMKECFKELEQRKQMNNFLKDFKEGMKYYIKVTERVEQAYDDVEEEFECMGRLKRKRITFFEFIKKSQIYQSEGRKRLTCIHPFITVDLIVDEQS